MKRRIIKIMSRYFYPQNIFAKSILKHLTFSKTEQVLIDAPCGNGETSWHFSKKRKLKVMGYDLDHVSIENAKANYQAHNLKFEVKNIFDVITNQQHANYFCIINSLFLLHKPEEVLQKLSVNIQRNGLLFVIVPNIEGKNYKYFNKSNEGVNKLILKPHQFEGYFKDNGFIVKKIEPIVHAHSYGRKDVKLFSVFSHFYLTFLNYFQTKYSIDTPNYYLIVSSPLN